MPDSDWIGGYNDPESTPPKTKYTLFLYLSHELYVEDKVTLGKRREVVFFFCI